MEPAPARELMAFGDAPAGPGDGGLGGGEIVGEEDDERARLAARGTVRVEAAAEAVGREVDVVLALVGEAPAEDRKSGV